MRAVIMAGGKGTRLYPLTLGLPKPMISMFNLPVIEYTLKQLKTAGIKDIAVTLQFMPQSIMDYFGNGNKYGVNLNYFIEDMPLGTAGSVKNAAEFLTEDFLVISGDAICNFNIKDAKQFHEKNNADVTMLLYSVKEPLEYGVVVCNDNNDVVRFIEKPPWSKAFSDTVNTGIYICKNHVLDLIPDNKFFDFSKDLFPYMLSENKKIMGFMAKGFWCDIGDIGSYLNCHFDILNNKNNIGNAILNNQDLNWYDDFYNSNIKIIKPSFIGKNVQIGEKCTIGPYAVIEDDCIIASNTIIKSSVVKNKTKVGDFCLINNSIIDNECIIENNTMCLEGSVIGQGSVLSDDVIIMPNVSVWSKKTIKSGQKVLNNIVSDVEVSNPVFKGSSIEGSFHIQFTLEIAVKLGAVIGDIIYDKRIIISCDETPSANLIKMGIVAGLCNKGTKVYDTVELNEGALCFLTRKLNCKLGIYIKSKQDEIIVALFNELGVSASHTIQRDIEKKFKNYCQVETSKNRISKADRLEGAKQLYIDDITSLYPIIKGKNININGSGINFKIAVEVLKSLGFETVNDTQEREIFFINDDGLEIIIDENKVLREESLILLAALVFFKENIQAKFCVPVYMPYDIEEIARKYGGKVERLSCLLNDEIISQNHLYSIDLINDPIKCICHIACYCVSNNISILSLLEEIPECFFIKKDVDCSQIGRATLMKTLLNEAKKGKYDLHEGIKIYNDNGFVLVIPKNYKEEYKIYAQGNTKEFAQELCDFYQNKINTLRNKKIKKIKNRLL